MKKLNYRLLFILFILFSCNNKSNYINNESTSKEQIVNDKYQKFVNVKRKNTIYNIGCELTYSFKYQLPVSIGEHNFKDTISSSDLKEVSNILIKVVNSDINDSENVSFQYNYPPQSINAHSSIIENENEVWIHPPRLYFFKILEINPFPYIKKPLLIGKKWNWKLKIGEQYGDKRWKVWKKEITNYCNYEIIRDTLLTSDLGKLNCYVITSSAKSEIGTTYLTSYFNSKYGFIRLQYTNIDGSKIMLELKSYKAEAEKLIKRVGEF